MFSLLVAIACNPEENASDVLASDPTTFNSTQQQSGNPIPAPMGGGPQPPAGQAKMGAGVYKNAAPSESINTDQTAVCSGCDIVFLSVCSLRKDHVGIYGTHPYLTPQIDSIASNGFVFERAYAASNFTLAGLTSMLTGMFASSTGVTGWDKGLTGDVKTLPEVLGYYG